MALNKIISVKSTGRFRDCSASGDVTLKEQNLIFAENGRGKTTLCAILRSLQSGEPAYILGRKTLGYPEEPEVKLLLDTGPASFENGGWDATMPDLAVFDGTYTSENVHAGDAVDTDQRRNLYRVIIGSQGVAMARRVEDLDRQLRDKTTAITIARAAVARYVPEGMSVEDFLAPPEDADIDNKIATKQRELDAVQKADQIAQREGFSTVSLPELPGGFSEALGRTIEGIAAGAEQRIADHIRTHHMIDAGEPWLSEGLPYIADDNCPFCGQSLDGIALIDAYKAYFSEAYHSLKDEIAALAGEVETLFSATAIATIQTGFEQNDRAATFWKDYCTFETPALDPETDIPVILTNMRSAALSLLTRKKAAPLEAVRPDDDFAQAQAALAALAQATAAYNKPLTAINELIAAKKEQTCAADVPTVQAQLARLTACKTRHTPEVSAACQTYQTLTGDKSDLEGQKKEAKAELDEHTESVIEQYGRSINRYLDRFNAGFQISTPTHDYRGRTPSSSYNILINETPVPLGKPDTPLSEPSFKNTLSSGDRSTLALAFFFAELEQDPGRAQKSVVLDDPFTSQDTFRRTQTALEIKRCGDSCAQMLLLSHDPRFLKLVWDLLPPADRKALQLARVGERNTTIAECDIDEMVKSRYREDVEKLQRYYSDGEGNARDVVQKLRPVLEGYCHNLYPSQFTDEDMLGGIISKIRAAGNTHPLFDLHNDLEDLNEYTKRYHHGENPDAATEPIDDTELAGFVKRTLSIAGNLI